MLKVQLNTSQDICGVPTVIYIEADDADMALAAMRKLLLASAAIQYSVNVVGAVESPNFQAPPPVEAKGEEPSEPDTPPTTAPQLGALDKAGVAFDPAKHSGSLNKDGTWRARRNSGAAKDTPPPASSSTTPPAASPAPADTTPPAEFEDAVITELLAAEGVKTDTATPPVEEVSNTDLQNACNLTASKLGETRRGDIKKLISEFSPTSGRSADIPQEKRPTFLRALARLAESGTPEDDGF